MEGPGILAASMSARWSTDSYGNAYQYHSQSDHHSKVACWGALLDVLTHSPHLQEHVAAGHVGFGINHKMQNFRSDKEKALDLVVCTPDRSREIARPRTFVDLAAEYEVVLTPEQRGVLAALPPLVEVPVGSVRIALEAKAAMTAHQKAIPRLEAELTSSFVTVHGASAEAVAAGLALVNLAPEFISPPNNRYPWSERAMRVNRNRQPAWTEQVIGALERLPRRTRQNEEGFDALGIVVIEGRNDGTPMRIVTDPPAPQPGSNFHYEQFVHRVSGAYARFR